jgi:putative Mg2+ transporter-C (MgtC) family protein
MGFIGGGAILRKDGFVLGVTTAATLWFVTVIGLCFGGGQILLGLAALALCMFVLSGLRWLDRRIKQEQQGILTLTTAHDKPTEEQIQNAVRNHGYKINISSVAQNNKEAQRELEFRLQWRAVPEDLSMPAFLKELSADPDVCRVAWKII